MKKYLQDSECIDSVVEYNKEELSMIEIYNNSECNIKIFDDLDDFYDAMKYDLNCDYSYCQKEVFEQSLKEFKRKLTYLTQ